ncbi:alpha/beta hydrolase [Paenibacillus sp. IB182496]|uniref:Alpha/beta hydrolase n=1 Tax=Paenibacillus sabuli TaxID=2772509 RepID=A0A927GPX1_9BACL|nr:alpha/beta hydrolase [Paenibacillus sabuli]MBD2843768.1 alpha/beta hydrolase [Paenibacillus sabuli]
MGHYIEVEPNVNVYVRDTGEGPAVLLLHGWPLNHAMFEYQITALTRRGFRVVALDQRGFGRSDAPAAGYGYDRLADDVRAVIDRLQLDNAALVGFSVGGAIATRYMARHAGHGIARLALLGAAAPLFTQRDGYPHGMTKDEVNEQLQALQSDRPAFLKEFGSLFLENADGSISEPFQQWLHQLGLQASAWGTVGTLETLRDEDLREDLTRIGSVDTVIFHGALDKICVPELAVSQQQAIPGARLVTFERSGHGMLFDEPDKFNEELLAFLSTKS